MNESELWFWEVKTQKPIKDKKILKKSFHNPFEAIQDVILRLHHLAL